MSLWLRNRTVQNVALGLGTVASALVLASGIIWYPLIEVSVVNPLAFLFVVVGGIWLGAAWPARLALRVGNAAVIGGLIGILIIFSLAASVSINPILFFGAALMIASGYALVGGSLLRGVLAKRIGPA